MQETQETQVWSLGWEDLLEKSMAIHSNILAWRLPQTEKPGGLQSMGSQKSQIQLTIWTTTTTKWWGHVSLRWWVKVKLLSRVWLLVTPWTVAYQAPPSMGFSRQEYWSALPFPSPGDLPDPGIEPGSPAFQADALTSMMRLCNRTWQELPAPSIQGQLQILLGPRQVTWRDTNGWAEPGILDVQEPRPLL